MALDDKEAGVVDNTELEIELLRIVRDEYVSLESISGSRWRDSMQVPSDEELVRNLRELQDKELVQAYRFTTQEYVPIEEFDDEWSGEVWWFITDAGRAALGVQEDEEDGRRE